VQCEIAVVSFVEARQADVLPSALPAAALVPGWKGNHSHRDITDRNTGRTVRDGVRVLRKHKGNTGRQRQPIGEGIVDLDVDPGVDASAYLLEHSVGVDMPGEVDGLAGNGDRAEARRSYPRLRPQRCRGRGKSRQVQCREPEREARGTDNAAH